jgi:hypothetical protein
VNIVHVEASEAQPKGILYYPSIHSRSVKLADSNRPVHEIDLIIASDIPVIVRVVLLIASIIRRF